MNRAPKLLCGMALICGIAVPALAQTKISPPPGGSVAERYHRAESQLAKARESAAAAVAESQRVAEQELSLQENLVRSGEKLQQLEETLAGTTAEIDRLNGEIAGLQARL